MFFPGGGGLCRGVSVGEKCEYILRRHRLLPGGEIVAGCNKLLGTMRHHLQFEHFITSRTPQDKRANPLVYWFKEITLDEQFYKFRTDCCRSSATCYRNNKTVSTNCVTWTALCERFACILCGEEEKGRMH